MKASEYWQNFALGAEIDIACSFIYDGLRNFHEMDTLEQDAEVFSVLYNLSVGLERLLKVTLVLLEYQDSLDPSEYEKSLITHNHLDLLTRIKDHKSLKLGKPHNEFLDLLGKFYKSFRYGRYSIASISELSKEKIALQGFLKKHSGASTEPAIFGGEMMSNSRRLQKSLGKLVGKIVSELYELIRKAAHAKNIYTYETRPSSKARTVIHMDDASFYKHEILWKELLVFLMNTDEASPYLDFIKEIDPLNFDIALIQDYLGAIGSDVRKPGIFDELESLYADEVEDAGERLKMLDVIGDPHVFFD